MKTLLCALLVLLTFSRETRAQEAHFEGDVVSKWIANPKDKHHDMEIVRDFVFVDGAGKRWEAKSGERVDGASIPKWLWNQWIGTPFIGNYRRASVIHDYFCKPHRRAELEAKGIYSYHVHKMFEEAMLADGTDKTEAWIKWIAVDKWGPQWGKQNKSVSHPWTEERDRRLDDHLIKGGKLTDQERATIGKIGFDAFMKTKNPE